MKTEKSKTVKQTLFYTAIGLIVSVSSLGLILPHISIKSIQNSSEPPIQVTLQEDTIHTATISSVGDIMAHKPQLDAQYDNKTNSYSFHNNFKYVKDHLSSADLTLGNLETTFAGTSIPFSSYPSFNTPDALSDALKSSGFDILSTINNHSFDKGNLGFFRTLEVLKDKDIQTVGTRESIEAKNYIIKDINNIKFGITAFSYGELVNDNKFLNGIKLSEEAKNKSNIFPQTDPKIAFNIINKTLSKLDSTDMQVVIIHWGEEYQREPNNFQKELAKLLCDRGVDIIIGSHPHVVQPVEMITSSDGLNETLVIYSLGNFISNQRREYLDTPYTEDGLIVDIEVSKNQTKNETYISKVNCIPTWVNKYSSNGKVKYEIIPLMNKETLLTIPNLPLSKAEASYNNTSSQIKQSDIIKVIQNPFI